MRARAVESPKAPAPRIRIEEGGGWKEEVVDEACVEVIASKI